MNDILRQEWLHLVFGLQYKSIYEREIMKGIFRDFIVIGSILFFDDKKAKLLGGANILMKDYSKANIMKYYRNYSLMR